jgi:hypothetical protein
MFKEEVWALEPERRNLFLHHREVHATADGYRFRDCRIAVTVLPPRRIAGLALPQTRVIFEGSDDSALLIYRQFQLRFLSAGR